VLTLTVPRTIPVVAAVVGVVWGGPTVVALATGGRVNPIFAVPNLLVATGLLLFAVATVAVRVVLDEDAVTVRSLRVRGQAPMAGVRGIALRQDGGLPRLRVALRDGDDLVVPAWSLVARHPDGEVEPAAEALTRFGAEHGVAVRVRRLTDPVQQPPPRSGRPPGTEPPA
jgi:hypothetical protein